MANLRFPQISLDDLYKAVYPGIMARAMKLAKQDTHLGEDWAGEAVLRMIAIYKKYQRSMPKEALIKFVGKSVARWLSVFYRNEKYRRTYELEEVFVIDTAINEVESKTSAQWIAGRITNEQLREFFLESFNPTNDTVDIVEKRITIRKNAKRNGRLRFNIDRDHPTDAEIGRSIGISKATASRFRTELKKLAEESEWL